MPIAHGFDKIQNVALYHLNAYTYCFPSWNPDMAPEISAYIKKATKGILEGEAEKPARDIGPVTEEKHC